MPDNKEKILFVTSHLSRQLIALMKYMIRDGLDITIAAPKNENFQYLPNKQFIRLSKLGGILFGNKATRHFDGAIVTFDKAAERMMGAHDNIANFSSMDIGLDLNIWNPKATSGNRQTMLLSKYNIPATSKMLLAVLVTDKDVRDLNLAIQNLDRHDFIIGLYGKMTKGMAHKISRKIANSRQIIYLGNEQDLPTLIRASFAVISLSGKDSFYKIASMAMGRATAWPTGNMKPNIIIRNNLAETLEKILSLPVGTREGFELDNVKRATHYDLSKTALKIKNSFGLKSKPTG